MLFHGVSQIDMQVRDLAAAREFWVEVIGLNVKAEGEGYVDIDSGNVVIRLIDVPSIEYPVAIRVDVSSVGQAYQRLLEHGAKPRYAPMDTPDLERIACVTDSNGHAIILRRTLSEDEWGFVPELPKTGEWMPDAEDLLVRLLSHVPAFFRMLARRKVTRVVEELAREEDAPVTREHVIRGYITSSAKVTRYRLIEPLRREGIDPDDYPEEFDYE